MKTGRLSIRGQELILSALSANQVSALVQKREAIKADSFLVYELMRQTISDSLAAAGMAISAIELGDRFQLDELVAMWTEIMNLTGLQPKKKLWGRL